MANYSWPVFGACLLLASCDRPAAFAPEIIPPKPGGPAQQYPLAGQVVSLQGRQPIPGATGEWFGFSKSPLVTDAAGRFSVTASAGTLLYTISAPGYLDRSSGLSVSGARDNVTLDMISLEPPFSLEFYRQFARNSFDEPTRGYSHTNPWPYDPRFYIRTVTYDSGEVVPDTIIQGVRRVLEASVPELSGGRLKVGDIRVGPAPIVESVGWVEVSFARDVGPNLGGQASLGFAEAGRYIHLKYYGDPALSNLRRCEDGAVRIAEHEVAHTMGFFHTDQTPADLQSAGDGCPGSGRSARARFHAAIMYSRPRHNLDPDRDPPFYTVPAAVHESRVIRCGPM